MENKPQVIDKQVINKPTLLQQAETLFNSMDITENTKNEYLRRLPMFFDFVEKEGFTINTFMDYKKYLSTLPYYSISTKNKYLTTARIFLKELNRIGQIPQDITQNIKCFRQSIKHKKDGISDNEMEKIMQKVTDLPRNGENIRLKALLSLLSLQGLRQVEIARLDVADIDLVNKTAWVLGKGRDEKEQIHLQPATVKALKEYMNYCKIKDGALFVSTSRNSTNKRLTTRSIRGIIKEFLTSLNIDKTTHGFRHYFTTTLIKTYKGDLTEVSRYTRHKSLEMLQVYNDRIAEQEDLPRFYNAFRRVKFS